MELILARPETSAIRGEQGDWISSSCLNTYRLVESRRPRTRSESQHAEGGIFDSSEVTEPVQQEVEGELRARPYLRTDSSSDEEQLAQSYLVDLCEEDKMSYPYPKYNDKADAEAHVRTFLMIGQANHVSQRWLEVDANKSKIADFGLSFDG